jgi:hypothetical protein
MVVMGIEVSEKTTASKFSIEERVLLFRMKYPFPEGEGSINHRYTGTYPVAT